MTYLRAFALVFALMSIGGFLSSHIGAGVLCLFMTGFMLYGERQLAKRDAEFYATPAGARQIAATAELLERHQAACTSCTL